MAETTIEWADYSFNPWEGCQKVSPGCDHCYAEARDKRFTGGQLWGPHATRRRTGPANWRKPLAWNKAAFEAGKRARVFCASLADVFDNHPSIPPEWRADLWRLADMTPHLDWLLLTKRPQNIVKMMPADWHEPRRNVWFGTTAESQTEAERRIPHLLATPAAVRFISAEPLLGPVDLTPWLRDLCPNCLRPDCHPTLRSDGAEVFSRCGRFVMETPRPMLDWVICGGESGPGARPMHPDWARSMRDQCQAAGVAFHFKQWGEFRPPETEAENHAFADGKGHNGALTPDGRFENRGSGVIRVGKKAAGRLLDGRTWDQMPEGADA